MPDRDDRPSAIPLPSSPTAQSAPPVRPVSVSTAPGKGIGLTVGGTAIITFNDAIMKWLSAFLPVGEALFVRGGFAIPFICLLACLTGGWRTLRVGRWKAQLLRGSLVVAGSYFFFYSVKYLPLADVVAIGFAGPLFTTALAPFFLGERVGWRRWSAVLIGFGGVLLMVRPQAAFTGELGWIVLLPLCGACTGAVRDIVTRKLMATETTSGTLLVTTFCVTLSGLATWPLGWVPLDSQLTLLLAATSILLASAHFLLITAYRFAEAALIAPFRFINLLWAAIFGYLFWGDVPSATMLAGTAVVIGSNLFIWHRETRLAKRR